MGDSMSHDYSTRDNYGENLKCRWGTRFKTQDKAMIERLVMDLIESWWEEFRFLGDDIGEALRSMPIEQDKIGHFTQMAWADTRAVGCGVQRNDNKMFLVCNYNPKGNYAGRAVVPESSGLRIRNGFNEDSHIIPLATRG